MSRRTQSFLQAILVVGIWSSSPPLLKIVLEELSPLQINGVRYSVAFLTLLPVIFIRSRPIVLKLNRMEWLQLAVMGLLAFSLGNSILYTGLKTLPATTSSFLLNGIPIATVLLGTWTLGEHPRWVQWGGILLTLVGGVVFFGGHIDFIQLKPIGLSLLGVLLITIYGLIARAMTRSGRIDTVSLTAIPMGFGGLFILYFIWPFPQVSWRIVGILAWLTFINSAAAFIIWNHALKNMRAFEISVTGNLMPFGTALLAPLFLGEWVSGMAWVGMSISLIGVIIVGLGGRSDPIKTRTI